MNLDGAIAERKRLIEEIEELWIKVTGKSLAELDKAIMKKFQTTEGRPSLEKWSIEQIKQGLKEKLKEKDK